MTFLAVLCPVVSSAQQAVTPEAAETLRAEFKKTWTEAVKKNEITLVITSEERAAFTERSIKKATELCGVGNEPCIKEVVEYLASGMSSLSQGALSFNFSGTQQYLDHVLDGISAILRPVEKQEILSFDGIRDYYNDKYSFDVTSVPLFWVRNEASVMSHHYGERSSFVAPLPGFEMQIEVFVQLSGSDGKAITVTVPVTAKATGVDVAMRSALKRALGFDSFIVLSESLAQVAPYLLESQIVHELKHAYVYHRQKDWWDEKHREDHQRKIRSPERYELSKEDLAGLRLPPGLRSGLEERFKNEVIIPSLMASNGSELGKLSEEQRQKVYTENTRRNLIHVYKSYLAYVESEIERTALKESVLYLRERRGLSDNAIRWEIWGQGCDTLGLQGAMPYSCWSMFPELFKILSDS